MVFAVASVSAVFFYDTECYHPFAMVKNIHYASITDVSWSSDGATLAVSSGDGTLEANVLHTFMYTSANTRIRSFTHSHILAYIYILTYKHTYVYSSADTY